MKPCCRQHSCHVPAMELAPIYTERQALLAAQAPLSAQQPQANKLHLTLASKFSNSWGETQSRSEFLTETHPVPVQIPAKSACNIHVCTASLTADYSLCFLLAASSSRVSLRLWLRGGHAFWLPVDVLRPTRTSNTWGK